MNRIEPYIALTLILLLSLFVSCNDNSITPRIAPVNSLNLIQNPSFEANGNSSLQSWWISDTNLSELIQDAPQRGGKWSLAIYPGWIPEQCFARTFVSGQSGTGIYQLTVLMKNHAFGALPYVLFGRGVNGQIVNYKYTSTDSINWTTVSIIDTLSLQPNDTLAIQLSGGYGEIAGGRTLFDVVTLQKIQ